MFIYNYIRHNSKFLKVIVEKLSDAKIILGELLENEMES